MWTPVSLVLENFRSYESLSYNFQIGKTTLIYAKNLDELEGSNSNGAGKSAILLAITLALVDVPNKDLTKEDYVLDSADEASVTMELENLVIGKKLKIVRRLYRGNTSSELEIWEDDKRNKQITSVGEGNKKILELLDISREDLLNYYLINQLNKHSFFASTDTDQKKIIARFTNTEMVDKALKSVQEDVGKLVKKQDELNDFITQSNTKIELWEQEIIEEEENKETEKKELLEGYNKELGELNDELSKLQIEQQEVKTSIQEKKIELVELGKTLDKPEKLLELLKKHKKTLGEKEDEETETISIKSKLEKKLAGVVECPKCKHSFVLSSPDENVKDLKGVLQDCDVLLIESEKELDSIRENIRKVREKLNKSNLNKEKYDHLDEFINDETEKVEGIKGKILSKKDSIVKYENKILEAKKFKKNKEKIRKYRDSIDEESEKISKWSEEVLVLGDKKSELDFWVVNFGLSGFKTFLINKVLSVVEGSVNYYLHSFRTNLLVKINGYKVLKSGKVKENIDILVSRDGQNWVKYKRLSGGQCKRVDVCGILTLQKLINNSSKTGGLSLICLDEFFESLDSLGQRNVLKILEKTGITTLVVSHSNNDIGAEYTIDIEYKNGVSKLV